MIIEHRTRDKHQNADSLSKKTKFYERQKQREANRPEIKEGFSFMDKETYDSLPLTRWLEKSGKPIQDQIQACERWVNACLACLQVKDPRKMKFSLNSVESSEFNEVVQLHHQKICMTESGYNQILVIIDHFTKLAEAGPCQTASA